MRRPYGVGMDRHRSYFVMMGVCLTLFVLAWAVVVRFSVTAAVVMCVVAAVIPPVAAAVANSPDGGRGRRRRPGPHDEPGPDDEPGRH